MFKNNILNFYYDRFSELKLCTTKFHNSRYTPKWLRDDVNENMQWESISTIRIAYLSFPSRIEVVSAHSNHTRNKLPFDSDRIDNENRVDESK